MIQKLLLIIIIIMVSVLLYLTNKIASGTYNSMPEIATEQNISPASLSVEQPSKMPMIWDVLKDRNVTKVYLSYEQGNFDQAMEVVRLLEKDGLTSVYLASSTRDVANIDVLRSDDETMRALKTMDVFAVLYSPMYAESPVNNQEYGIAIEKQNKMITILTSSLDTKFHSDAIIKFDQENHETFQKDFLNSLNPKMIKEFKDL